jgi:UDP-N-acetylmuramyl pentapeptide phosphotransferase/UDP-N-acetylglucosamine-1-phosphate transferase
MRVRYLALLAFLISFLVSGICYPFLLKFAKKFNIVDNPNYRKLQRQPIPVFGGPAVWLGVLAGICFALTFVHSNNMYLALITMSIMLMVGVIDDVYDLSAALRFIVEVGVVWCIIAFSHRYINCFHGLWGIGEVSDMIALPLSIIAGVGIINAINLIDGVDGYSSGFCVFASLLFAFVFFRTGVQTVGYLGVVIAGALMPFFFHNVFGKKSKMFIGDGGTLMLGTVLVIMLFNLLFKRSSSLKLDAAGYCIVPFTLAVFSIPVFDTLRVMVMRILRKKSPFKPDKTHLHHLFIDMKFSHIGATVSILTMNSIVVLIWYLSCLIGLSSEMQLYIVLATSLLFTAGFYWFMRCQERKKTRFFIRCCAIGRKTHIARTGFWKIMMNIMDYGGIYNEKNDSSK